jgi:hypothetical protein
VPNILDFVFYRSKDDRARGGGMDGNRRREPPENHSPPAPLGERLFRIWIFLGLCYGDREAAPWISCSLFLSNHFTFSPAFVYCSNALQNQPLLMEPAKEIETILIQAKKYNTFLWPFMFGGVGLTIFFGGQLRSAPLMFIGLAIFVVAPLVLNRLVRSFFIKRVRLQFFPDRLIIEVVNDDTDVLERTDEYAFADMVNYRTGDSVKTNSSYFSMRLGDGRKVSYTFWPPREPPRGR